MIWSSRASGFNRSCASRPMRMPIGIKTPNLPWTRVPSLIHSSGVSERHGDEAISANANVATTSNLIKGAPCCVSQLSFVFDSPRPCKYGHATKDQDKATAACPPMRNGASALPRSWNARASGPASCASSDGVAELRAHWRARQEQRMALGIGKAPADSQVLATFDGKPRSPNAVTKEWTLAMSKAKLPQVTLHSLRHTHASMLIASGMDILTISRRLGHASPTVTLAVYGHLIKGTDERAAAIMDAAFARPA